MDQASATESEAARLLVEHWQKGTRIVGLPEAIRPKDRAAGYRIGGAVAEAFGEKIVGWKIAATSTAGQAHINVDGPLGGRLLASRMLEPGGSVTLGTNLMRVAEAEFAFQFARDLPSRSEDYTLAEVMDAVASLHPSIEVPDSRYEDFTAVGAASLIADTACACWLMVGPAFNKDWRALDLAEHDVRAFKNKIEVAVGKGKAALGDPRIALHWLVNEVSRYAGGIKTGDLITTGTCVVPVAIAPGDHITVDYGVLGAMSLSIA